MTRERIQAQQVEEQKRLGLMVPPDREHDDLQKKAFGRVELMVALVHIAIIRYVLPRKIVDVSDALHTLLLDDISTWPAGRLESLVSVPLRIR